MTQTRFRCEACGRTLVGDGRHAGRVAACPKCGATTTLVLAVDDGPTDQVAPLIDTGRRPSVSEAYRRRRNKSHAAFWAAVCLVLLVAAGGAYYFFALRTPPLVLVAPPDQTLDEGQAISAPFTTDRPDGWQDRLRYELLDAPEGATIDPATGAFRWSPGEEHGPAIHTIAVRATAVDSGVAAQATMRIAVNETNEPPAIEPIDDVDARPGETVRVAIRAHDPDVPAATLRYALVAPVDGAQIDAASGLFTWTPTSADAGQLLPFRVEVREAIRDGLSATAEFVVHVAPEERPAETLASASKPEESMIRAAMPAETPADAPAEVEEIKPSADAAFDLRLLEYYRKKSLLQPKRYSDLRKLLAERFEREHREHIDAAFAGQSDFLTWLDEHAEIKEEFYTALQPDYDEVPQALELFRDIWLAHPELIERYASLAIAVAVTWDQPKKGVVHYEGHANRAKATVPEEQLDGLDNFNYLVAHEEQMQGRAEFLPWEFLTLLVNHTTPLAEREWALAGYLPKRSMFGGCYSDVPYDYTMLETESAQARMNGQAYTLPNLLTFGGVCALQADFASRVGKSIGVPAAYVGGGGRFGESHAWVMWVELTQATPKGIAFTLESHGRYRGDHYYVGTLADPQTGQPITDRQLELRLHTVGIDVLAARQAKLAMRCYPRLAELADMSVTERFRFLRSVLALCPGNEPAWTSLAQMSTEPDVQQGHQKEMRAVLDALFDTFAGYPDFTWQVFDDLVGFEEDLDQRIKLFERLEQLYLKAERPDLAFTARHKVTDYLIERQRKLDAIEGLAAAVNAFPDEGQYVPGMLDRIEALCDQVDGSKEHLAQFYLSFLPKIPQTRGGAPSKYCVAMYERGISRFKEHGLDDAAVALEAELAKVKNARRGQ